MTSNCRTLNENGTPMLEIAYNGNFSVAKTFDCGQCFRFDHVKGSKFESEFSGVAYGKRVSFAEDKGKLYILSSTEEEYHNIWHEYLGLDVDYGAIDADILSRSDSPALKEALEYGRGIRILRQEPWEAVFSFIVSQNNNIP